MKMRGGVIRRSGVSLHLVVTFLIVTVVLMTSGILITRFVNAETSVTPPDSCFVFSAGTITNYYDTEGDVDGASACPRALTIPSSIGGEAVTSIGQSAFQSKQLTAVIFPNSVTSIEANAFSLNNSLVSIDSPGVTNIGDYAFWSCQIASIDLPAATDIGESAFAQNNLASISVPSAINIGSNAFGSNKLTSIDLPSAINVGSGAFGYNKLVSFSMPHVTHITRWTFEANQLTTMTLPGTVTSIEAGAFSFNRLTDVSLPASLQSLDPVAFMGQNPWGGIVEMNNPDHYLWSDDPSIVQGVYSAFWYPRLYTANPSNPQNFIDGVIGESWYSGADYNDNGTQRDSFGGNLINPAPVTIRYVDSHGTEVRPSEYLAGIRTSDNTPLRDYLVASSNILAPIDPFNPTPQETTELQDGFAQYYHIGQSKTFSAPAINGYVTPANQTVVLAKDTTVTFVYQTPQAPTFTLPSPTTGVSPVSFTVDGICSESVDNQTVATIPQSLRDMTILSSAAFTVNCAIPHTEAGVSIALDRSFNRSLLKVFKQTGTTVTDITDSVTFASEVIDGKTVTTIHYTIKDGGFGDEDETVDGKIVDPIFVTYAGSIAASPDAPNTGIATFSQNAMIVVIGGAALALAMAILLITMLHVSKRSNK